VHPVIHITSRLLTPEEVKKFPALTDEISYCEIIFQDNGIGFDKQFTEQMFQIFQRLNSRDDFEGTGIGLALCKGIVVNHHGEIYADTHKKHGTQFHIILPVEQGSKFIPWKNQ
jgi:two-component system CheB/CheR fusion protein